MLCGNLPVCHCEPVRTLAWQSQNAREYPSLTQRTRSGLKRDKGRQEGRHWRQGDGSLLSPFAVPFRACRAKTENRPVFKFQFIEPFEFCENLPMCHSEPVRTLAWESVLLKTVRIQDVSVKRGLRIAITSLRTGFTMTPLSVFCICVNRERLCVSAYFLFNKTTKTHQNVIASQ